MNLVIYFIKCNRPKTIPFQHISNFKIKFKLLRNLVVCLFFFCYSTSQFGLGMIEMPMSHVATGQHSFRCSIPAPVIRIHERKCI